MAEKKEGTYRIMGRAAAFLPAVLLCFVLSGFPGAGTLCAYAQSGDGSSGATDATTDTATDAATGNGLQDAGTDATSETQQPGAQTVITMVGKYDSADLACVVLVNESEQKITLRNHDTGRNYTLEYDSGTRFIDPYGRETNPQALETGALADVTFLKSTKHLNSLKMSSDANIWRYEDQRNYTLPVTLSTAGPTVSSMATIAGQRYLMDVRTLVLVEGKQARPSAIVEGDLITAWGEGNEVYCVQVTRGHGYLRLSSDTVNGTSLVGAWIELGNSVIRKITPRMLVTAPEGDYTLYIIGNGANYSTDITIERGKETVVDTKDIPIEKPKEGKVRFSVTPQDAKIRVDERLLGSGEDTVTLQYGLHTLELVADGYATMFRYLRVGSPNAVVKLEMEKTDDAQTSSGTSASSGSGTASSAGASSSSGSASSSGTEVSSGNNASGTTSADDGSTSGDTSSSGETTDESGNTDSNTDNTQTEEAGQEGVKTSGRIYVDAPPGAAFYLDGNFIGFVPVSFEKTSGIHTVTLSQEGRRTVSYNIEMDNDKSDKTFNFPAMEPE